MWVLHPTEESGSGEALPRSLHERQIRQKASKLTTPGGSTHKAHLCWEGFHGQGLQGVGPDPGRGTSTDPGTRLLDQLNEWEQAAALADAANFDDDEMAWGLVWPDEQDWQEHTDSMPAELYPEEAVSEDSGEDLCEPCCGRASPEPEAELSSQARQEDVSTDILNELRELHRDGQQVMWPQGWSMGEREQRAERPVRSSPVTPPDPALTALGRAAAGTLELADLLDLHRDGLQVSWPTGWYPYSAAVAIHTLRASPVGSLSRPEPG